MAPDATFPAIARAVAQTSGRAARQRAAALAVGVLAVGGVLFGPNGLGARDLTEPARHSPALRAALWSAWTLASLPFARALLGDPSLRVVIAQPVSRARLGAVLSAALGASQVPWAAFRARAEGRADGVASLLAGVVGAWAFGAMPRGAAPRLAAVALALTIVVTPDPRAVALAALVAGAIVLPAAMASLGRAERAPLAGAVLPRAPFFALVAVHARLLARTAQGPLARHAALAAGAAALTVPTLRNNAGDPLGVKVRLALTLATVPLATLSLALASAFVAHDGALRPRLVAEAVPAWTRAGVALTAVSSPPALLICALTTVAARRAGASLWETVALGGASALWGAGLAAVALLTARRGHARGDSSHAAGLMALVAAAAMGALLAVEQRALAGVPAVMLVALVAERWRDRP